MLTKDIWLWCWLRNRKNRRGSFQIGAHDECCTILTSGVWVATSIFERRWITSTQINSIELNRWGCTRWGSSVWCLFRFRFNRPSTITTTTVPRRVLLASRPEMMCVVEKDNLFASSKIGMMVVKVSTCTLTGPHLLSAQSRTSQVFYFSFIRFSWLPKFE